MSIRALYLIGFLFVSALLLVGVYIHYVDNFQPCPLCTLQRLCFTLLGITFLIGALFHRQRIMNHLVHFLALTFSTLGFFLAARQVWLQFFASPSQETCGVSLQYMMQILPLKEVLEKVLQGSAECAERGWAFLTLNMAEWSMIWFGLSIAFVFYLFSKKE